MIIPLQSALVSASIDGGRSRLALGLVDPFGIVEVLFIVRGRQVGTLAAVFVLSARTGSPDRPLDTGHQVADDLLGDEEDALNLDDRLGRCLEEDDVVGALAERADLIGETAPAPR